MSDRPTPIFKQTGRRLQINTRIQPSDPDIDPLLLIWAKGSEEISQPYTYSVKMWRLVNRDNPPIPPADLINTRVSIHLNLKETVKVDAFEDGDAKPIRAHVRRCGVFETFNDEGFVLGPPTKVKGIQFRLRQYSGTIVPPFKMMAYETAYRVFENKSIIQIIDEVSRDFPNFKLNKDKLGDRFFPKMQYCVQYNETTFNFLSRLMAQFGIWYFFDHNRNASEDDVTMMLGAGRSQFDNCKVQGGPLQAEHPIHKLTEINNKDLAPCALTIKDFQRIYAPMTRRARFGNFNILNPADPITNAVNIQPTRDLIVPPRTVFRTKGAGRREPDDDDRFRTEHFAAPVDLNSDTSPDAPNALTYTTDWMRWREASVARVSGSTRNVAFMPGFLFERVSPPFKGTGDGEDPIGEEEKQAADAGADIVVFTNPNLQTSVQTLGTYLLLRVEFEGMVISYSEQKDLAKVLSELLFPKNLTTDDLLANSTVQALNDYLQKAVPQNIKDGTMPELDIETLLPGGSGFGMVAKLIPLIAKIVDELKDKSSNDFHCSFAAIPLERIDYQGDGFPDSEARLFSLPLPGSWYKPVVNGPHLAVVIGQDGVKTDPTEIFADSLGRVRVRFPWDHKPGEQPRDAFKRGDNACWVRVSEAWAGRQFGTQFLPRIGQEVIVDFLDGDPDRPIITGRVYNADRGFANLPFTKSEVDLDIIEQKDALRPVGSPEFRFEGIKTSSTPSPPGNGKPRYHLTRFDDKLNCEQYLIRSQGRLDVTAFAHSFETTYGNKHVRVVPGKDKDGKTFGGSEFTTVGGEYDLHIGAARYEGVDKAYNLTVKADTVFDLQTVHHTMVGTESMLNAKTVVIEAPIKITLKVGSSFVVLDPAGVWIQGPVVMINSGGAPGVTTDVEVIDPVDAEAAEPGDQWMKRVTTCDPHPKGSGGGRRGRTVKAKHGLPVTFNPADQSFSVGAHGRVKVDGKNKNFADSTISDLATIDQTPSGHALLDRLDSSGHTVNIQERTPPGGARTSYANNVGSRRPGTPGTVDGAGNPIPGAGTGSDSTVSYSPGVYPYGGTNAPGDAALYHELTHADHAAHGNRDRTPRTDNFDNQEEFNTIQEENQYRDERQPWPGSPAPPGHRRTSHHDR